MKQIIISRYDNDILTVGIDTFHFYCLHVSFYIDNIVMSENTIVLDLLSWPQPQSRNYWWSGPVF